MASAGYEPARGATRDRGPRASAAKSESVESVKKTPLAAGSQSWGQEIRIEWPPSSSQAVRISRPAKVTTRTVSATGQAGEEVVHAPGEGGDEPKQN
jgi:hypothetical protein